MRGPRRTVEPFKGPTRRRHPLFAAKWLIYTRLICRPYHGEISEHNSVQETQNNFSTDLSSCRFFNSLSSNSLRKLDTSQRSMSRSAETFSSSARNRTTSFVRSIVAISIDNHCRHRTSLITNTRLARANRARAF